MSVPRSQLRQEAKASRERIVATVHEMRDVAEQTRDDAVATAKRNAPLVAGGFALLVLARITRSARRRRRR